MIRRLLPLAAVLALSACQTQWFLERDYGELVTTEVVVKTDPPNAHVSFDGVRMAKSPVRIPVEYHHSDQLWSRQNNYGARMREDWSTTMQIIGFPVWGIASFFHFSEDMQRHVYSANQHVVSATLKGHHEASEELLLEGEAEVVVELKLEKK